MLTHVRSATLAAVAGLETAHLDYRPDAHANSIGALLLHIAAAEAGYQVVTFENRSPNAEDLEPWGPALELGDRARREIRGADLGFYLDRLSAVRERTLTELRQRQDAWLAERTPFKDASIDNYYKWFHVFTHEVNHRGQIRWLRVRALHAS
jgi:uncharacterized damage-inducible protein DinB